MKQEVIRGTSEKEGKSHLNPRSLRNGRRTTIGRQREKRKFQKEKMVDVAERDRIIMICTQRNRHNLVKLKWPNSMRNKK